MKRLLQLCLVGICVLSASTAPAAPRADGQGKESHETQQNKDGTWTQTDTKKDGSKKVTQMDKDRHKTKEADYDEKGHKYKESDWAWNEGEKVEVKRMEHFFGEDGDENLTKEYDENGVLVRVVGWIDGIEIVDTYVGGKWVRRDKKKGGKVIKTETPSSRAAAAQRTILPPPNPPTFSQAATLQGSVVAVPDRFAPGESISFKVVKLSGEVVADETVKFTNSQGELIETRTDSGGNVSAKIPNSWSEARIDVLGLAVMTYAGAHLVGGGPSISQPPKFIQAGNVITVHGDNFSPDMASNKVTIGDQDGVVLGATPNALTVLVPAEVKPGTTQIQVTTGGRSSAKPQTTVIGLAFDPGPGTLLRGQHVTRTLRVSGTTQKVPIQITDPSDDSATITNAGLRTSSGGSNNVLAISINATSPGNYSVGASITLQTLNAKAEAAAKRAEAAASESYLADFFAQGEEAEAWRKAAAEWRLAAKAWRDAMHAWEDGDEDGAKAAEASAKAHEEAARRRKSLVFPALLA